MNTEQRQMAADPWTKPTDLSHWPACRQLRNYVHHRHTNVTYIHVLISVCVCVYVTMTEIVRPVTADSYVTLSDCADLNTTANNNNNNNNSESIISRQTALYRPDSSHAPISGVMRDVTESNDVTCDVTESSSVTYDVTESITTALYRPDHSHAPASDVTEAAVRRLQHYDISPSHSLQV